MIRRMEERIQLLRAEVEGRGSSWLEFQSAEEVGKDEGGETLVNGTHVHAEAEDPELEGHQDTERSQAWSDGTFQTGRIVNGEVRLDGGAATNGTSTNNTNGTGGRLNDEALRRAMEERMRALTEEGDADEGMHL